MDRIPDYLRIALLSMTENIMESRPPDFTAGDSYLQRWHLGQYGGMPNGYIHRFTGDDDDGALHDHPYDNVSVILKGSYAEHFHVVPQRVIDGKYVTFQAVRYQGEVINRKATDAHRLTMLNSDPVISLFLCGTRFREWGFHCTTGWIHFREFLTDNGGRKGCP